MFREEGVDISNQYENPNKRPEMKGPQNSDIDNILAGLKPKSAPPVQEIPLQNTVIEQGGDDSVISIASLKDMQNANMPKNLQENVKIMDQTKILFHLISNQRYHKHHSILCF